MADKICQLGVNQKNFYYNSIFDRKNHTNYAIEVKKINLPSYEYGKDITIDIPFHGDLLGRMFFEIDIPNIDISDTILKIINESNYKTYLDYKNKKLSNINININTWQNKYDNLYNYAQIQIDIYLQIKKLLKITNFNLSYLQNKILELLNKYDKIYEYQILIEKNILNNINISGYILDTDFFNNYNYSTDELVNIILTEVTIKYNYINYYLNYYHSNITNLKNNYDKIKNKKIFYKWIEDLSHFYFENFELNINGFTIDKYSNDFLHLFQTHSVHSDYKDNYDNLIGNTNFIYENTSNLKKIYTPLIFSNCNNFDSSNYLPLISLQNSSLKLFSKINNLTNLIYFNDWEKDFEEYLYIDIHKNDHNINNNNTVIKYNFGNYSINEIKYMDKEHIYRYIFTEINPVLLKLKLPNLSDSEINSLFEKYGVNNSEGNKIMKLNDWIYMKNNIKLDDTFTDDVKLNILDYHFYIDYNYLLNIIPQPKLNLLLEYAYLDDIEKIMLTSTELKYLIETHHEISFNILESSYDDSIDDITGLVKEIYYFTRPLLLKNGYSKYSKSELSKFKDFKIIDGDILLDINISSNEYNILESIEPTNFFHKTLQIELLNSNLPDGVFYKTFSLMPNEKIQPTGVFDLTTKEIKGQDLNIIFDETLFNEYLNNKNNTYNSPFELKIIYTKYNVINISKGMLNLELYS
jgi:hypothetical protein